MQSSILKVLKDANIINVNLVVSKDGLTEYTKTHDYLVVMYDTVEDNRAVTKLRAVAEKWTFHDKAMGEQYINFTIHSESPIAWAVGDYCIFRGETYTLNYIPSVTQKAGTSERQDSYVYDSIKFDSRQEELTRCQMRDIVLSSGQHDASEGTNYTGSVTFQLFCGEVIEDGNTRTAVCTLADRIQANLNAMYGTGANKWTVEVDTTSTYVDATGQTQLVTHTDNKMLSFDNNSVAEALAEVHNIFGLDYYIHGRTISIGYSIGNVTGDADGEIFAFGYGRGYPSNSEQHKGLFEIKKVSDSSQQLVTRLRTVGSSKNLRYQYYHEKFPDLSQALIVNNLQLPDTFLPEGTRVNPSPNTKWANNAARIAAGLRAVQGAQNDAYIEKNDNAATCPEGIREATVKFDGSNKDLEEIYPSIEGVNFQDLRSATGIKDLDDIVCPNENAFAGYGADEDINTLLAIGYKHNGEMFDDANVGSGILPQPGESIKGEEETTEVSSQTETLTEDTNYYKGTETPLFELTAVRRGKYFIVPVAGKEPYYHYQLDNLTLGVGYIIRIKQQIGSAEPTTIAEYISDYGGPNGSVILPTLPDVFNMESARVKDITVTGTATITVTFTPIVQKSSAGLSPSLTYNIGSVTSGAYTPKYVWAPVSNVDASNQPFHVFIKDMGFDVVAQFTTGGTPMMVMKSGNCNGMEFQIGEAHEVIDYQGKKGYMLTLVRFEDSSLNTYYPNANYQIAEGDYYVFTGIDLPDVYVEAAESRLLRAATLWLAEYGDTKFKYQPSIDEIYLRRNYDNMVAAGTIEKSIFWRLYAGWKVKFADIPATGTDLEVMIESVTITMGEKLTRKVDITLNDEVSQSTLKKTEAAVKNLSADVKALGSGMTTLVTMATVKEYTDNNFLSKVKDDTTKGNLKSEKNIIANGGMSAGGMAELTLFGGGGSGAGTVTGATIGGGEVILPNNGILPLPAYPAALSDLASDYQHRVVTDAQIALWNAAVQPGQLVPIVDMIGVIKTQVDDNTLNIATYGGMVIDHEEAIIRIEHDYVSGADNQTSKSATWKQQARANIGLSIEAGKMWYGSEANTIGQVATSEFGRSMLSIAADAKVTGLYADKASRLSADTVGNVTLPVFFTGGVPQIVTGISVPGNVESTNGGMSAGGIADLSMSGGGGAGTVTAVKLEDATENYPDNNGVVSISKYISQFTTDASHRLVTDSQIALWNGVADLVPAAAYDTGNSLADKNFVNSSVATATADYKGNYNLVSDLSLTTAASHSDIAAALAATITGADNNDYCFVEIPTADGTPTQIAKVERYKFNGTAWSYEYTLNNSSFTANQWAAINSGITSAEVIRLSGVATGAQVNVLESVKLNGTALTISDKAVNLELYTLTIQRNGDTVGTFTPYSAAATINIADVASASEMASSVKILSDAIGEVRSSLGSMAFRDEQEFALDYDLRVIENRFSNITAGTAGTSSATSGVTLSVPYVTVSKYGIVTAYGVHTHTIPDADATNKGLMNATAQTFGGDKSFNGVVSVAENINGSKDITAGWGVAAGGIASLSVNGGGGSGTLTQIKINGSALTDDNGVVDIPLVTTLADGAMSHQDKSKLNSIEENANNYTLPVATSNALGGVKIGYTTNNNDRNYAVQLSEEKMFVNVPWENTWRPVVDDLTHTDTDKSLSAKQGKVLSDSLGIISNALGVLHGSLGSAAYRESEEFAESYELAKAENDITILYGYFSSGSAKTALKLKTAVKINGTDFDGSQDITTGKWGTSRNITIKDADATNAGTATSVDGSGAIILKLPSTIKATLTGNASTATKLANAVTLWGQSFDGSSNISGALTGVTNIDTLLYFDTTHGRLGLGVSSPDYKFHIDGGIGANGDIQALNGGMAANGIADLALGGGGGGTVTGVKFDSTVSYSESSIYSPSEGLIALPSFKWGNIQSKPTTVSGYRITDAYTKDECDSKYETKVNVSAFVNILSDAIGVISGSLGSMAYREDFEFATDYELQLSNNRITILEGYFTNGAANNAAKLGGQSSSYYATASSVSTLQGYFTNGILNQANMSASNIVGALGTTAVNRAKADASGNTITSTYETIANVATKVNILSDAVGSISASLGTMAYRDESEFALAYDLEKNYLSFVGGIMSGTIYNKMDRDTSNYKVHIAWLSNASESKIAEIGYHNTVQKIFINATGATDVWNDQVGKYSLGIGSNSLTYNTYTIYHAGNSNKSDVSWTANNFTFYGTLKPNGNATQDIGDQNHNIGYLYINNLVTPSGNGMRFGANNGDFVFYGSRTSWDASYKSVTIGRSSGITVHKGNLSVVAGGVAAGGIADLS